MSFTVRKGTLLPFLVFLEHLYTFVSKITEAVFTVTVIIHLYFAIYIFKGL